MSGVITPLGIVSSLSHVKINQTVAQAVDQLEATELECIRGDIRAAYFDGRRNRDWNSINDFGEEMFRSVPSAGGRRNLANRLINKEFGTTAGPTREAIIAVAQRLGISAEDRLHLATTMGRKREETVRIVLPEVSSAWTTCCGSPPPPLPFQEGVPFRPPFTDALTATGMPGPEQFDSMRGFNEQIEAIQATIPNVQPTESFWAAVFGMYRPFLWGFERRLLHAARDARSRGDANGDRLMRHIRTTQSILRLVRQSARALGETGELDPGQVIAMAAEGLTNQHKIRISGDELTALLHAGNVTIQAIRDDSVRAGWLIWHNAEARMLAHALLPS
jgi:hypothetical protein